MAGGGRIALVLTGAGADFSSFSTDNLTAYGGQDSAVANNDGAAGTIYLQTTAQGSNGGQLIINNNNLVSTSTVSTTLNDNEATTTTVGSITIQNKGKFNIGSDDTLTIGGTGITLTVNSDTILTNNNSLSIGGTGVTNSGTWTNASSSLVTYTGQTDDSAVTVFANPYGKLTLNNSGTTFNAGGNLTIYATTTISAGTFDVTTNNYSLTIGNDWVNNGTFTPRGGTVTFATSTGAYFITSGGSSFYNLTFNDSSGSATWQLQDALDANNNFTITGGTLNANGKNINVGGNWLNSDIFTANSGAVTFDATDTGHTIDTGTYPFYGLIFNGTGGIWDLSAAATTTNALTITTGAFDLNGKNFVATGATFSNNGTLRLQSGETLTGLTMDTDSGTIEYDGTGAHTGFPTVLGNTYYGLKLSGGGTWTLNNNLDTNGSLTIDTSTTLNTSGSNYQINVGKDWANSGTFTANSSAVILDGTGQTISGSTSFYNLTKSVSSADTLTFGAGTTQTISNTLTLSGIAGSLLSLRSGSSDSTWYLNPANNTTGNYLSVRDSTNLGSSEINCRDRGCENAGNNSGWLFDLVASVGSSGVAMVPLACNAFEIRVGGQCLRLPPPALTVDLKANGGNGPLILTAPATVNLSWLTMGATVCLASGDWPVTGLKLTQGSEMVDLSTARSYTFRLICSRTGEVEVDRVTITVLAPPLITVSGCTDALAENYNSRATDDDGTCQYQVSPEPDAGPDNLPDENDGDNQGDGSQSAPGGSDETIVGPDTNLASTTPLLVAAWLPPSFISTLTTGAVKPIVLTMGLLAGAIPLVAVSGQIFSFYDLYLILIRAFRTLLSLLGLRKRAPEWGTVYDAVTKHPIDPVYVSVLGAGGKRPITNAITDLDGRYGFLLSSGAYHLAASKTHYRFPSLLLAGHGHDEVYSDLYFGEPLVLKRSDLVTKNIPLDPVDFDWNEFVKQKLHLFQISERRRHLVNSLSFAVYLIGLAIALLAVWNTPSVINQLVVLLYVVVWVSRRLWAERHQVTKVSRADGTPIAFAVIRAFVEGIAEPVKSVVTDVAGRFYCLLRPGIYYFTVEEKLSDGTYRLVHKTTPLNLESGLLDQDLTIE